MKDGRKTFQTPRLEDGIFLAEDGILSEFPNSLEKLAENLVYGLREYMESIGQKRLVLGLSG